MKFRLAKGFNVAEVAAGQNLYRLDEAEPELSTWDMDAVASLVDRPGVAVVEEKVADVVAQIAGLSDRELKSVHAFDRRDGVQKAVAEEFERRHEERMRELAAEEEARAADDAENAIREAIEGDS